ncbi:unnamed protein product [Blepharisma stoltei]|uniref:Uncharacterized protein n=1 Tax=Blepharisma stoltei TaxID=1481888 RepID=A0AAU9IBW5_9CILI|nr:unnamed protein product [Blepharisma stoltei]
MLDTLMIFLYFIAADFYPAYSSLKAYKETEATGSLDFWHKFWIVRSLLLLFEYLFESLLLKIPAFYIGRFALFVFLSVFGGAGLIYDSCLGPFLETYQESIDKGIAFIFDLGSTSFRKVLGSIRDLLLHQFREFINLTLSKKANQNN